MLHTKEFYELMEAFEKVAPRLVRTGVQGFKREHKDNWGKQWYYFDGNVNDAFKLYMCGYANGKAIFQD